MCPSTVATEVFLPSNFRYLMICQVVINVGSTYSNCNLKVAVNVSLSWSISMISITSVDMHGPLQVQQLYDINGKSPRWKSRQMWQIREKEREREQGRERERVFDNGKSHKFCTSFLTMSIQSTYLLFNAENFAKPWTFALTLTSLASGSFGLFW